MSRDVVVKGVTVLNDQIYDVGSEFGCYFTSQLSGVLDIFKYDPVADRWLDVSFFDCEAHSTF